MAGSEKIVCFHNMRAIYNVFNGEISSENNVPGTLTNN